MKRFLLIVTGAFGSLAAILSITPPQFGHGSALGAGSLVGSASASTPTPTTAAATPAAAVTTAPATPAATTSSAKATNAAEKAAAKKAAGAAKKAAAKAAKAAAAAKASGGSSATTPASATPAPVASTPAATTQSSGVSGTFTGAAFDAREPNGQLWGAVTVTVTLKNGKIVSASGSQSPSSRGPYAFSALDPFFATNQMTLAEIKAESASKVVADSLYVSRVTYSSLAYWSSIKSALSKAGI